MKRRWKILIGVAAVLVVALVGALVFLNSIAKAGISKGATYALGATTTVRDVDISIVGGSADIRGLVIANPEGFGDGNLLELSRAYASVKTSSLLSDVVEVNEVVIDGPVLKLRQHGMQSNLGVVLANIDKLSPATGEAKPEAKAAKKYRIGSIKLTGAHFEYSLMGAPTLPVPLPDITLTDLTNADGTAMQLGQVIKQVLVSMAASAAKAGGNILPADVKGSLDGALKGVTKGIDGVLKGGTGAVQGMGKGIDGMFKGFGGKKEDAPAAPEASPKK